MLSPRSLRLKYLQKSNNILLNQQDSHISLAHWCLVMASALLSLPHHDTQLTLLRLDMTVTPPPMLSSRALFTWEKVRSRSESMECRPRAGYVTLICISIEAYYPSCGNNRGIKLHTAPIKWLPCGSFYYFMHKFAFKIPPLTFCILPGLGIAAVDIWEDQKLKLFIRSQTPSSVFPHRRSEIIPSLPRTLFASPWIKCINISSSLTCWLRHLIIIETLWAEADKRDNVIKYLASLGYQISVRVSAVPGYYQCLHVYLFTHIPVHSADIAPISWHDTLSPLLSLDSIILEPEARLVAQAA